MEKKEKKKKGKKTNEAQCVEAKETVRDGQNHRSRNR